MKQTSPKTNLTRHAAKSQDVLPHNKGGATRTRRDEKSASDPVGRSTSFVIRVVTPPLFRESAVLVTETDWLRMRAAIAEIDMGARSYQVAGSVLAGAFVSFACLCLGFFFSAAPASGWLWTLGVTLTCCSGVLSGACFFFDSGLDKGRTKKRDSLLKEADRVEARFKSAISSESSRKRRGTMYR